MRPPGDTPGNDEKECCSLGVGVKRLSTEDTWDGLGELGQFDLHV